MNRGVEIDGDVADDPERSVILDQVEIGVAVRMACLDLLTRERRCLESKGRRPWPARRPPEGIPARILGLIRRCAGADWRSGPPSGSRRRRPGSRTKQTPPWARIEPHSRCASRLAGEAGDRDAVQRGGRPC